MSLLNSLGFVINHPLNRDQKVEAVTRFLRWQIGSRLLQSSIIYRWVNDSKFIVKKGETGLTGNIYAGLHEFYDMAYVLHVLSNEDLFIDVGANMGSYSILSCAAVGATGIAFEPVPSTFNRLVENIRINNIENNVMCINKGVGSEKGAISFTNGVDTTNHVISPGELCDDVITVDITSLDEELCNHNPSLIKIDVEGFELPVLQGAKKTLENPKLHSIILELNGSGERYGFDESLILDLLFDNGFKTYSYNPFTRELDELNGKCETSGNTLFIRDKYRVQEILKTSPRFIVNGKEI
jgi:FkbM family methyltransferase